MIHDLGLQKTSASSNSKYLRHYGLYECPICLTHFRTQVQHVNSGRSTKCRSCASKIGNKRHGMSKDRIYIIYKAMKSRCYNKNNSSYSYYGGLSIKVCDEWLNDFMSFLNWSMSNGYNKKMTIDRINPYGNYEPSNCRWATYKTQANNTRTSLLNRISIDDISDMCELYSNTEITTDELSLIVGVSSSTVWNAVSGTCDYILD